MSEHDPQRKTDSTPVMNLVLVSGGLNRRSSSSDLAETIGAHAVAALRARGVRCNVTKVSVRHLLVGIAHRLSMGVVDPELRSALAAVNASDGLVAVAPVFNGQIAGHTKAFFDLIEPGGLKGIPVAFGATGGSKRHSLVVEMNLRPLFAYLRALPTPTAVFSAKGDDAAEETAARAAAAGRELAEAMLLLRSHTP